MTDKPDPHFTEAEAWLRDRNISSRRTSKYQLKIGRRVSFYPNKGTIFVDGEEGARPNTGLGALEEVLREHGYIRRDTNAHTTKLPSPTQPTLSVELIDAPDPD